ncbi:16S rRNA (uracil(1498)-N(3))-methyltransferase [Desulforamulus ferrireducens]|uniref:Ribosomal RNA small subunit methyltransferase E n=1 Tax=Desulforamulus ferrireducens TaxID=1833852 RepID=A0A1S6IYR9_9FIRM|nr:16S rRNA (uracil(1498)-N(3))-methyltransferase [Desulforamulus ferrireducens]AQS59908.1 16S rRNA (uracil(1498)-N(3))-methyltransferase [Desulforamulus ferrireducens]
MARFFVPPQQIQDDKASITGSDVKHIRTVLRMVPGDRLTLLDGRGMVYQAEICDINKEEVLCRILSSETGAGEPTLKVSLVQGLPKGDKMESIIQKCTELGVHRIIPLAAARSVVKLEGKKVAERQERWQRVALEAAKQCRRPSVPEVQRLSNWEEILNSLPADALLIMPWEEENSQSLRSLLQRVEKPTEVYLFIGPEGGFEQAEVTVVRERGCHLVTLGERILRTETAGPAVLTMVLYHFAELG